MGLKELFGGRTEMWEDENGLVVVETKKGGNVSRHKIDPTTVGGRALLNGVNQEDIPLMAFHLTNHQAFLYPEAARKLLKG